MPKSAVTPTSGFKPKTMKKGSEEWRKSFGGTTPVKFTEQVMNSVIQQAGTSAGAKKAWDTRGRGRKDEPRSTPAERGMGYEPPIGGRPQSGIDPVQSVNNAMDQLSDQMDELDQVYQDMFATGDPRRKGLEKAMNKLEDAHTELDEWLEEEEV